MKKELQREMMRSRAGKRAARYKERLEKGWRRVGGVLAQLCLRKMKEKVEKEKELSKWEKERSLQG